MNHEPLPEPDFMCGDCTNGEVAYTDDQMRAFYADGFRAGMERAAQIVDAPTITPHLPDDAQAAEVMTELLRMYFGSVAAAIRAETVSHKTQ